jgi:hypothetical protein
MKMATAVGCATLFVASLSHSDSSRGRAPTLPGSTEEATTDAPAISAPGAETPPRDPFSPYEIGPEGTRTWRFDELPRPEQAEIAQGHRMQMRAATIDAYGAAVRQAAQHTTRDAAARKLGLEQIELIGVVP